MSFAQVTQTPFVKAGLSQLMPPPPPPAASSSLGPAGTPDSTAAARAAAAKAGNPDIGGMASGQTNQSNNKQTFGE